MKFIVAVISIFLLINAIECLPDCNGENEAIRHGLSSSCDIPTCENKDEFNKPLRACTADYTTACICINNTFRHPNGSCVAPEECP